MARKGSKGRNISSLGQHSRDRKTLSPPFAKIGKLAFKSWTNDRLPEVLWAVLLSGTLDRGVLLTLFRVIAQAGHDLGEQRVESVDHSDLANIDDATFDTLFAAPLEVPAAREALRYLLVFDGLPDRTHWARHLQPPPPNENARPLADSVGRTLDHQSEQSTDCRWMRLIFHMALGKIFFSSRMEGRVQELLEYPDRGTMESVRPSIRAAEITLSEKERVWPAIFWKECLEKSDCVHATRIMPAREDTKEILESYGWIYTGVATHFLETLEHTGIDARHDAVFGLTLYSLSLTLRAIQTGDHGRPGGRVVLRTLVECYLTLAFLLKRDDEAMWAKYREHGTSQAKLAFLKLYELEDTDVPSFVDLDELERLANEDAWQEFSSIELGQWAGVDLRKMSEEAGAKDIYDKYYGWPSGYAHAHWGAVRDTVFDLCLNPLHRFHRVPALPRVDMPSVLADLHKITNLTLDRLNQAYPKFKERVGALPPAELQAAD